MNQNRNTNSERGSRNTEPSLPSRSWRPPIAQPIRKRHERRRFDMMNQAAPNRKCLHRHQILQHARRRIRRRAATSDTTGVKLFDLDNPAAIDSQADRRERVASLYLEATLKRNFASHSIGDGDLETRRLGLGSPQDTFA